jgi:hypothetical protein
MKIAASHLAIVAASLLLAECASAPETAPGATASVADKDKMHCTRELPIGSQMPVTRCRTLAQIEQERAEAGKVLNAPRQTGTPGASDRTGR